MPRRGTSRRSPRRHVRVRMENQAKIHMFVPDFQPIPSFMTRLAYAAGLAALLILPLGEALAQTDDEPATTPNGPRGLFFALDAELFRPKKNFREFVGRPTGVAGHLTYPVWTRGSASLGIRGDVFWVRHFHKELTYDVSVAREFYGGLIGPQLSLATGPVRPYVAAGFGTTRFWTVLNVDEDCDVDTDPNCVDRDRVRQSDYEASTVLTGGTYLRIPGVTGNVVVLLHLAGQIHRGGTPDVRTLRDGTTPGQPDVRYTSWHIGLSLSGR